MKRALISFCIVWTILTVLVLGLSLLLGLFAASRSQADIERVESGAPPKYAARVGSMTGGGTIGGRYIAYERYKGLGYYINVFKLGPPSGTDSPQKIDVDSFSGYIVGPSFPVTVFDDSSSYVPIYNIDKKRR